MKFLAAKSPRIVFVFLILTGLGWIYPLLFLKEISERDWGYFNSLSLIVRSSIFSYGEFPLHDPWVCGGVPLLGNPQNRIFSPLGLLDVVMNPAAANLFGLMVYAFFGMLGMYFLLKHERVSERVSILVSGLFINSSWFGLHYAEGHIPYGSFQLLPWVWLCFRRWDEPKWIWTLAILLALFLLDGGIYSFIFSFLLLAGGLCSGAIPLSSLKKTLKENFKVWATAILSFSLLVLPKVVPVLDYIGDRKTDFLPHSVSVKLLLKSFLAPFQKLIWSSESAQVQFHEFGCYIGVVALAIMIGALLTRRTSLRGGLSSLLLMIAFWIWVGTGWGGNWNPWSLIFERIPLINLAHVQSRVWLLAFFFLCIVLARSLDRMRWNNSVFLFVAGFLTLESLANHNIPFMFYDKYENASATNRLITKSSFLKTLPEIKKPDIYYQEGVATKKCYEPATKFFETSIQAVGEEGYRGEVFVSSGKGSVEIEKYIPSEIHLRALLTPGDTGQSPEITLNTKDLKYWIIADSSYSNAKIVSELWQPLRIQTHQSGAGEIVLRYRPPYLAWIVLSYLCGILSMTFFISPRRIKKF